MMLFKLSIKNIKKSFKDYAIYFLTLILGVAIFYVFNAIDSQTAMMELTESTAEIIELMNQFLTTVSVFVSIVLGFLIIYASRFLIKRRNKEFGIYLTLGMSKRKISTILFIETLLIGIISLLVGLALGIIASQFMSIIVANMFEANMTNFKFTFSETAYIKSIIYFGIMYILVMIFNILIVSKCKLIDLLHSNKKNEKIRIKNPIICIIVFILSCIFLGYAYNLVTDPIKAMSDSTNLLKAIAIGSITTFLIFWSLSGLLLKIFMSLKKIYYKKLNSFTLRQVSSKINTMVFSLTIISLMLFITLGILTTATSMKNSLNDNIKTYAPVDYQIAKYASTKQIENNPDYIDITNKEIYNKSIKEIFNDINVDINKYSKDLFNFYTYKVPNIDFKTTSGNKFEELSKTYIILQNFGLETIMPISKYNELAKIYGMETFNLNKDEYIIVANMPLMVGIRNEALSAQTKIEVNGVLLHPKYRKCKNGNLEIATQKINEGIIIVPDNILKEEQKYREYIMGNYKAVNKKDKLNLEKTIFNENKLKNNNLYEVLYLNTKLDITEASVGLGALVTFIGLYLGIIFLISSSAILALKELSESSDNKERFMILRKLGADEKMINQALFRQIAVFFLFPLVLAIIHSIFGMKFISTVLSVMGIDLVNTSTILTYIFLLVIYGVYFIITYTCSKNIIKEYR